MEVVGNETFNGAPKLCCRACLNAECKLFNIHENNLADAFTCISGIIVSEDHLPQHLCGRCSSLITKYMSFRMLCINSYTLFMSQLFQKEAQDSFSEHHKTFYKLTSTAIESINSVDVSVNEIKQEQAVDVAHEDSMNSVDFNCKSEDDKVEVDDVMNKVSTVEDLNEAQNDNEMSNDSNGIVANKKDGERKREIAVKVKKKYSEIDIDVFCYIDDDIDTDDDRYNHDNKQDSDDTTDNTDSEEFVTVKGNDKCKKSKIVKKKKNKVDIDDKDDKHGDLDDKDLGVIKAKPARRRKKNEVTRKLRRKPENDYLPVFDFATFEKANNVQIITLSKEEQLAEIEARKSSVNYRESLFHCEDCGKGFLARAAHDNHRTRHHPSVGAHACEICGVRYKKRSRCYSHQDTHRLKFLCQECGFVCRTRHQARAHYNVHAGKTYSCQHCGKTFAKSTTCLSHVRLAHPAMNVSCDACGETFVGDYGLRLHKIRMHKNTPQYACPLCPATFMSSEALHRHTDTTAAHAGLRPCERCGENCASETELLAHAAGGHAEETHRCEECEQTFSSADSLALHHRRKHLNLRYGEAERSKLQQKYYQRPRKMVFVCEECGRMFNHSGEFWHHKLSHTGVKPFQCSSCPKSFGKKSLAKAHERCHTGEKPYQCNDCPLSFATKSNLARHCMSVHLGIRPRVPCPICGRELSSPAMLRAHQDTQHRGLPGPKRVRKKKQSTNKG